MARPKPEHGARETWDEEAYRQRLADIVHYDEQRPMTDPYVWGLFQWFITPFLSVSLFFYLCTIPKAWPFLIIYMTFLFFDKAPENGGRSVLWMRKLFLFRWFVKYFPISLHKTVDLDPSRRYLMGYHPHGIFGLGCVSALASHACDFPVKFPGIKTHILTLNSNFIVPFYRDYLMAAGFCSVSRKSCENILRQKAGNAIVIVIGGAQESLAAHAGHMDLTLRRRFGFVKVAMHTGADLVPVIGFGENDILGQAENRKGSWLYWYQQKIKAAAGFTMPIFFGRGFLHKYYGWLPYRRPIDVVIGKPIPVPHCANPTQEQIQEVHDRYVEALIELWNENKDKYAPLRLEELRLID